MRFEDILTENGIEVAPDNHEHKRAGWVNFDCPYCAVYKHYRMGYNTRGHYLNCWACGRHGIAETLRELLGDKYRSIVGNLNDLEVSPREEKAPRGKLVVPKNIAPLGHAHCEYLRNRGFNPKKLHKLWEIKGIGLSSSLAWRIFIPIFHKGVMVSWTTRSIVDRHKDRYISAGSNEEAVNHKELLYGEDYCRMSVLVVEGPTDVWRIGPGSVCTFGTTFSMAQVAHISRYPRRAICFDRESTAEKRARELSDRLSVLPGETYLVTLETGKDPGEASQEEIMEIRKRFLEV